jgi:opacity protein-like surface antigen
MTKRFVFTAVFSSVIGLATGAMAQAVQSSPGPYLQLAVGSGVGGTTKATLSATGIGSLSGSEDLKAGAFVAGAVGNSFQNGFAVEGEALLINNDVDTKDLDALLGLPLKAKVQVAGVMANARYAVAPIGPALFHVGAGVGYGRTKYELLGESDEKSGAMWQVMAGLSYPVSEKASWDLGYRYIGVPDFDASFTSGSTTAKAKLETRVHVVALGFRYKY